MSLDFPSASVFYAIKQLPASDLKEQLLFFLTHSVFICVTVEKMKLGGFLVVCAYGFIELMHTCMMFSFPLSSSFPGH